MKTYFCEHNPDVPRPALVKEQETPSPPPVPVSQVYRNNGSLSGSRRTTHHSKTSPVLSAAGSAHTAGAGGSGGSNGILESVMVDVDRAFRRFSHQHLVF